jgi:hypothetical protein
MFSIAHPQCHRQAGCLEVHACIITGVQRDAWGARGVNLYHEYTAACQQHVSLMDASVYYPMQQLQGHI